MHISVLKNEITEEFSYLKNITSPIFMDGTFGLGGHSLSIAEKLGDKDYKIIGFDKDISALNSAKSKLSEHMQEKFLLINDDFKNLIDMLESENIKSIDGTLLDLGVSSLQIDSKERGFSFKNEAAVLDMRMDQSQSLTAEYILNNYRKEEIVDILAKYGEEKFAFRIAENIAKTRSEKHFETVGDLLKIIDQSIPSRFKHQKIHPATRTFQALRIEVNQELSGLSKAIKDITSLLNSGGKIAIISFHSLEDRIVKNTFKELAAGCICPKEVPICQCDKVPEIKILTSKPITPSEDEIRINARSRSAKLRIAERL